ncbi:MAG: SpaA isopeptide-forming pilin-related protein [Bifidobacterium crudilactis]
MGNSKVGAVTVTSSDGYGLRPAVRLRLDNLLLSGNKGNQGQSVSGDSRLTFVDTAANVVLSKTPRLEKNGANWELTDVDGTVNGFTKTGFGWKLIDPEDDSGEVVASGRTNKDAATNTDGNMVVPCASLMPGKDYTLSVWGQRDGSATAGWSNRATVPVSGMVVRADGSGGCAQVRTPPSYGIEVTGITSGMLRACKIGGYDDVVFGHTGALKSVKLNTPDAVLAAVLAVAVSAGGVNVDAGNPMGWVAANWLGYPTDPLSDDVTSAFSPYAGKLQVFAQELAKDTDALGASAGSLPAGMFSTLTTETVPVSGPGLYLIVDSTQSSGGSLPIVVGSKVFNEALEDVVEDGMVDFMDAGVKGKPRLGRAVVKTSVADVSKRVVNDAGLDGFDVGSEVEFEIALRVPDLSGLSGVTYDGYAFRVEDTAAPGLTLPQAADVRVLVDVPSPDTDVTATGGLTIGVSGGTLTVGGLKAVFAEDAGGHVANKATLPAGSLMRLRYAAVLNTGASFSAPGGGGLDPNENTVTLTRSTSDGGTESRSASAHAYSFKVDVVKVDKDDTSTALGDASFEVSRGGQLLRFTKQVGGVYDGAYLLDAAGGTEVTTHADGTLTLLGVEARELSFRETQAPDGYFTVSDFTVEVVPVWNADASEVTVASYRTSGSSLAYVSQDGRSVTVADPSKSLANLPYTGGVGILLLSIIGGVFLMVAVRPYYLSHRAEATANILM